MKATLNIINGPGQSGQTQVISIPEIKTVPRAGDEFQYYNEISKDDVFVRILEVRHEIRTKNDGMTRHTVILTGQIVED